MTMTLYIDVKVDLFLKINLTRKRQSTKKIDTKQAFCMTKAFFWKFKTWKKTWEKRYQQTHFNNNHTRILEYTVTAAYIFGWQYEINELQFK